MQAIILAGGFGTRLRSVLADIPKPMAPIHGKPFLAYLIDYLKTQGITDVILSVHYLREQIEEYFKNNYQGITIQYAIEDEPLGTGGAIVNALNLVKGQDPVFVLNGDTFLQLDYRAMATSQHRMTMALRKIDDCSRYGTVQVVDNIITHFIEKGGNATGLISAGVYLIHPELFCDMQVPLQFSIEQDFLHPQVGVIKPRAFVVEDYFIDIGIPEDYARAVREFV